MPYDQPHAKAELMTAHYVFGYGSLVNTSTHTFAESHPAKIDGWRRVWRHVEGRSVAFLTVVRAPGVQLEGVIARVEDGDWPALDLRERSYRRIPADDVTHPATRPAALHIYHSPEDMHQPASDRHPILLSYLDTVAQGYLKLYGKEGLHAFFETTDGWDAPILDDRHAPIYSRHQLLEREERNAVDEALRARGATIIFYRPV